MATNVEKELREKIVDLQLPVDEEMAILKLVDLVADDIYSGGWKDGYTDGHEQGYEAGWADCLSEGKEK